MSVRVTATHGSFDHSHPPVAEVEPGELVVFDCPGVGLDRDATVDDLEALELDVDSPHTIVGPVAIEGTQAGDALVVEVLGVNVTADYGHCVILPGHGLLPDDFPDPLLRCFPFRNGFAELGERIRIPIQPFCGIMGVAPRAPGKHSTIPPRRTGGNLDIRHLGTGSVLRLPIEVDRALFSCGDGHAAQGDGEVCTAAIETAVEVTIRFDLLKEAAPRYPTFTIPGATDPPGAEAGHIGAAAVGIDLYTAAQEATRSLIDLLAEQEKLTRADAYMLCSVAADLRISQIVNAPNWTVSAYLPVAVFTAPRAP